jgi:hypothetical protein
MTENALIGYSEQFERMLAEAAERKYNNAWDVGDYYNAAKIALTQREIYQEGDGRYAYWDLKAKQALVAFRASEPKFFLKIIERK